MKRLTAVILVLLLLCGCAKQKLPDLTNTSTTTQPQTLTPEPTATAPIHPGYYDPDHEAEEQTGGALQVFQTGLQNVKWIGKLDSQLLIISGEETSLLTLLSGDKLVPAAQKEADFCVDSGIFAVLENGFCYYIKAGSQVQYLNTKLQETERISLPEMQGEPLLSTDGLVFYVSGNEIKVLDPQTQISRTIRQISGEGLALTGSHFDDTVLSCTYTDTQGAYHSVYISAQTGETLTENDELLYLNTWQDSYFAVRYDGLVRQQIFGTLESQPQEFKEMQQQVFLTEVLSLNGALTYQAKDGAITVSFCNFSTGKVSACVSLPNVDVPSVVYADDTAECLWFAAFDTVEQVNTLYRWNYLQSPASEELICVGPLYTDLSPDEQGLQQCRDRAAQLAKQYRADIHIWQDALSDSVEQDLEPEYQVAPIQACLDVLEESFALFTDDFWRRSVDGTDSGRIQISIVRSIGDGSDSVCYWPPGGDMHIVVAVDADVQWEFLKAFGYLVINQVMGNAVEMDYWVNYNPEDFQYGSGEVNESYLEGESQAFADAFSMNSVTDDRSRLFAYAVSKHGQGCFQTEAMQGKLELLCEAIRDAYKLKKDKNTMTWEQYLDEPLSYVK